MKQTFTLTNRDGDEQEITQIRHSEWGELGDPCPECGATEYRHFAAEGGRFGLQEKVVIQRSDYWETNRSLMTQCRSCGAVLYQHPAFELIYDSEKRGD